MTKKDSRLRRAARTRVLIRKGEKHRLSVHRTPRHIYAQVSTPDGSRVLAACSTLESVVREQINKTGNVDAAVVVGRLVAERSIAVGVSSVAFDRAGFKYHGRVKALADAARTAGLEF